MGQMDFISSIFVRFIFQNYLGSISLIISDVYISDSQTVETLISVYIHVPFGHAVFQKAFWDKQCNFWSGFNVYVQPGQCFLQSPSFCESANIRNLHHFVSIFWSQFYLGYKNKNKFGEINILNSNFLSSSYGNESHKSVGYGKYTTLNMVLFLLLIGWKQKEVGGSWAK